MLSLTYNIQQSMFVVHIFEFAAVVCGVPEQES